MMKWLILLTLPILTFACSQKVVTFLNDDSKFAGYETFRIVNYKLNKEEIPIEGKQIFDNIESFIALEMQRRGYEISNISPDLLIRYEIISNQVTDVTTTSGYPYYYTPIVTVRTFLESALLLEMKDLKTDKLVWQASVDMSQYDSGKKKQAEIIKEAVTSLFNTYLFTAGNNQPDQSLITKKK